MMVARPDGPGTHVWRAPGRVTLIGDHTDYQDGLSLAMAIDRECRIVATPSRGAAVVARSAQLDGEVSVAVDGTTDPAAVAPAWGRFVAGAVAACAAAGGAVPAVDLAVSSTVPLDSGLSSSSALSVALVLALAGPRGLAAGDRVGQARLALDAEVRATGVPAGLLDQMTALHATAGHALLLDCRSLTVEPVPLLRSLGVVVVHSGRSRTLAGSAYAARRAAVEATARRLGLVALRDATIAQIGDDPFARHVVSENERVRAFADALRAGRSSELGPLMLASHASLRDDYAVSTPELDRAVELLMAHGALGARLTGAGFGGCVVGLVQRNHADDIVAKVSRALGAVGIDEPLAFAVRPAAAAGAVTPAATPGG
jgi:galactokinase